MKILTRSQSKELNLKRYFTGKPCKHGHVTERNTKDGMCLDCRVMNNAKRNPTREQKDIANAKRKASYPERREEVAANGKIYRANNKEACAARGKRWKDENKEAVKEKAKQYYLDNKEKFKAANAKRYEEKKDEIRAKQREYYEKNKKEIIKQTTAYTREFRRTPLGKTTEFIRDSLRRVVTQLKRGKEINSLDSVGYTPLELKLHLESLFTDGMNWDNYGLYGWHIDHVVGLHKLVKENMEMSQFELMQKVNCLSNLQPLWATDNLSKSKS